MSWGRSRHSFIHFLALVAVVFAAGQVEAAPPTAEEEALRSSIEIIPARAPAKAPLIEPGTCSSDQHEADLAREAMCNHPFDYVCGQDNKYTQEKRRILDSIFEQGKVASAQISAGKYGFTPSTEQAFDSYTEKYDLKRQDELNQEYMIGVRKFALQQLPADTNETLALFQRQIKRGMLAAIDAQPSLDANTKARMKRNVEAVQLINGADILSGKIMDRQLLFQVLETCRRTGLEDNGFQPPNSNLFVICPGSLITMNNRKDASGYLGRFQFISGLIAHEMAHTIDNTEFPTHYLAARSCLIEHYPSLKPIIESKDRSWDFMQETSADIWSAEAIAQIASNISDPAESQRFIQHSMARYCSSIDDTEINRRTGEAGGHSGGRTRIDIFYGRNPRLRQALGCQPASVDQPGCGLEGAVPAKRR